MRPPHGPFSASMSEPAGSPQVRTTKRRGETNKRCPRSLAVDALLPMGGMAVNAAAAVPKPEGQRHAMSIPTTTVTIGPHGKASHPASGRPRGAGR
jgi:hypothetical protein